MVAISLYRGNLHKVPDQPPRRWLMPTPKISLKHFKSLYHRRSIALSLVRPSSFPTAIAAATSNQIQIEPQLDKEEEKIVIDNNAKENEGKEEVGEGIDCKEEEAKDDGGLDGGDCSLKPDDLANLVEQAVIKDANDSQLEKPDELANPNAEAMSNNDELNDKLKRKKEIEEKLEVLNAKKHNLVLALKQILNAEEELKRRNSAQGMAVHPSVALQVDVSNDSGSMTMHPTPRMGSEANPGGDIEGAEAEDISNLNTHPRYIHRMSSTSPSPSSESPLRRPPYIQHNVVPHPSRSSLGTTGSPLRFAPTGHQGHPANLPTLSVSGTNYVASSPSPAASGGTSAFKDARHPSPWN